MDLPPPPDSRMWVRLFWVWLLLRTVAWTLLAISTLPNAPLDLIEWLSWGFNFSWGYPKHPPLPGWVAGVFVRLSPGDVGGVYLASYLHTSACLWAAWRLGREFLPAPQALIGALCLDGLMYLTFDGAEFSNNVALDLAWALTVLCFVRAVRSEKLSWWLTLGVTVGLGLLCKYTLGVLLIPLAGYLICDREARRHLRGPGPYVAFALALAVFSPHVVWLVQNDFLPFQYASERSTGSGWLGHLTNPTVFVLGQLLKLAPVLVVLAPLLFRREAVRSVGPDMAILHWAVLGPVALLLALSLASGCQLREIWGSPLWTFVGVWLLVLVNSVSQDRLRWSVRGWAAVTVAMMAFFVVKNVADPHVRGKPTRVHFPGRPLADEVGRRWFAHCSDPFPIVAGEAWWAGNVCCYSAHRPMLYSSGMGYSVFNAENVPWTNDADMTARGGVLLWDASRFGDELPETIHARFPAAEVQTPIVLPYQTSASIRRDRVGIAFVWPQTSEQ